MDTLALFLSGLAGTARISGIAWVLALALGLLVAVCRISPVPVLRSLGSGWVQFIRNCPLTVVLFFMAFGLPAVGVNASYLVFGIAGLGIYTSAFVCEAVRSGVNSVPSGQAEAARSLGMGFGLGLSLIVLPQAIRSSIPPLTNAMVAMIKNSAIVGAFGVGGDLFSVAATLTGSRGLAALPVLAGVIAGYLALVLPLGALMSWLERRSVILR